MDTSVATTAAAVAAAAAAATATPTSTANIESIGSDTDDRLVDKKEFNGFALSADEDEKSQLERRYVCPICHHSFTRKHNLKSHRLIHTDQKPYACSLCSKRFRRLHDMKRHEKLHSNEKPYACEKCGKQFARADALLRHEKSAAGCPVNRKRRSSDEDGNSNQMKPTKEAKFQDTSASSAAAAAAVVAQRIAADASVFFNANSQADSKVRNNSSANAPPGTATAATTDPALFLETGAASVTKSNGSNGSNQPQGLKASNDSNPSNASEDKTKMYETIGQLQAKIISLEKTVANLQAEKSE
ncbi:hypothetical protein FOA43_004703 [Brettanomyces nanus]|uniref:C2H2-type domain-containing protein n=1 Tax=Eeniella nana TaxID=13502 RepID=A0A875SBA6_EENNA|nr:uncharacterized protein FOA43_004703 [Brettanomyces nanus]QPG77295.1 hypothetical protein FOA43_004703 [Brettanomyces nanus]